MTFLIAVSTIILNERRLADLTLNKHILDTILVSCLSSATLMTRVDFEI